MLRNLLAPRCCWLTLNRRCTKAENDFARTNFPGKTLSLARICYIREAKPKLSALFLEGREEKKTFCSVAWLNIFIYFVSTVPFSPYFYSFFIHRENHFVTTLSLLSLLRKEETIGDSWEVRPRGLCHSNLLIMMHLLKLWQPPLVENRVRIKIFGLSFFAFPQLASWNAQKRVFWSAGHPSLWEKMANLLAIHNFQLPFRDGEWTLLGKKKSKFFPIQKRIKMIAINGS